MILLRYLLGFIPIQACAYLASCFRLLAAPVLCRGVARYTATIRNWQRTPPARLFSPQSRRSGTVARRDGRGVGRGTRCVARSARHLGTRLRARLRRGKARPGQLQMALDIFSGRTRGSARGFWVFVPCQSRASAVLQIVTLFGRQPRKA